MAPELRSSSGFRAADFILHSTVFRWTTRVGGHRDDCPPLAHIAGLLFWDTTQRPLWWLPWHAPAGGDGAGATAFVPGFVHKHIGFCDEVSLQEHSVRDELLCYWCLEHGT